MLVLQKKTPTNALTIEEMNTDAATGCSSNIEVSRVHTQKRPFGTSVLYYPRALDRPRPERLLPPISAELSRHPLPAPNPSSCSVTDCGAPARRRNKR
ncbi:hypothetical protein BRADI_4g33995v3 [Brachypodium distachyon]|uniref:Uncharacterized protein n=1 Tax=Brachypodium distachyon TaxID=15368 RepID=A0A2K2CS42_BRADI|nr:hypothetical protein BRADI_4g33995v3 [Brachypodium distachyon]